LLRRAALHRKEFNEHGTSNRRHDARALRVILFKETPWNSLDLLREKGTTHLDYRPDGLDEGAPRSARQIAL
jgi:hypothetical protein